MFKYKSLNDIIIFKNINLLLKKKNDIQLKNIIKNLLNSL